MAVRYAYETDLYRRMTPTLRLQLFDDNRDGVEDPGIADGCLEDAADLVDAKIGARYSVPLTGTIPGAVRRCALNLAWYNAHARVHALDESIVAEYEATVKILDEMADGTISIGIDPRPTERTGLTATVTSAPKLFGRANLSGI